MPRTPINYNNTIFYQILCRDTTIKDCYVGHTTDFKRRKSNHKSTCNNQNGRTYNLYLYEFIRDNGGWANFDMILIENRECADSLEARKIERGHIEKLNSTLNLKIPSRTTIEWQKEYREQNKEIIKIQKEIYYNNNKDKIAIYKKEYREKHIDEIQQYDRDRYVLRKDVMNQQKKDYRQNNLDEVRQKDNEKYQRNKEQRKEYYQLNKEKILLQKKEYRNKNKTQTIQTNDEIII